MVDRRRVALTVAYGTGATMVATALAVLSPAAAAAHGDAGTAPSLAILIEGWDVSVDAWLPAVVAAFAYWKAADAVDRDHLDNPVPRWRRWAWLAGIATYLLAVVSPLGYYDTTLFSVHMIQHLLLVMVAAPLLVLAAPVTLLLRVASPGARRDWILPVLHSRPVRVLAHPIVAWGLFAAVMWFSHFSPLFDAALDDELLHRGEHVLYLASGLLFWWPVVGADPSPRRIGHGVRVFYLALGMPLSSLLGLVIFSARQVLYPHYESLVRVWGPTPIDDQALAGGIMWAVGDGVFVAAIVLAVMAWLRHEEREAIREDGHLARQRARAAAVRDTGPSG